MSKQKLNEHTPAGVQVQNQLRMNGTDFELELKPSSSKRGSKRTRESMRKQDKARQSETKQEKASESKRKQEQQKSNTRESLLQRSMSIIFFLLGTSAKSNINKV